ncbi:MAG: ATP-binding protein [Chloroflexi bacterium]|nr:ATP-binding protein [Chloroflexota bacterium]
MTKIPEYIYRQSRVGLFILSLLMVFLFGVIDTVTGPQFSLSIFYLIPILFATWFIGRRYGFIISIVSAATWLAADLISTGQYTFSIVPLWNASIRLGFFIIISYAFSEIKKAGARNSLLASIVEYSSDAIIGVSREGIIFSWNEGAEQVFGYSSSEAVGRSANFLVPPDRDNEEKQFLEKANKGEYIERMDTVRFRKDGTLIDVSMSVSPIKDESGYIIGSSSIIRDITSQRQLESLKEDFINKVSHELRTPLTSIREAVSQVLDGIHGEITPAQKEFLNIPFQEIDRMKRLINNLLEVSKIEADMIILKKEVFDLVQVTREIIIFFRPQADKTGIELRENINSDKFEVLADKDKIKEIIINLVGNAIKFTKKGYIEISIREKSGLIEFIITDTGPGIPEEELPKIFDKFHQFEDYEGRIREGSGLGLVITKDLIRLHGGEIWVESKINIGTTFTFTLPGDIKS